MSLIWTTTSFGETVPIFTRQREEAQEGYRQLPGHARTSGRDSVQLPKQNYAIQNAFSLCEIKPSRIPLVEVVLAPREAQPP